MCFDYLSSIRTNKTFGMEFHDYSSSSISNDKSDKCTICNSSWDLNRCLEWTLCPSCRWNFWRCNYILSWFLRDTGTVAPQINSLKRRDGNINWWT